MAEITHISVNSVSAYFDCFEVKCVMYEMDESNFVKTRCRETRNGSGVGVWCVGVSFAAATEADAALFF